MAKNSATFDGEIYRTLEFSMVRQDLCRMQILLHKRSNVSSKDGFLFSADYQVDRVSKQAKKKVIRRSNNVDREEESQ